jgi:hypothetical protein
MAKTKSTARAKTPKSAKSTATPKPAAKTKAPAAKAKASAPAATAKAAAKAKAPKPAAKAKAATPATTAKPAKTTKATKVATSAKTTSAKATRPAKTAEPASATRRAAVSDGARARRFVGRAAPTPIEQLDATTVLGRIVLAARAEEELDDDLPRLLDRLEATLDPSLVPSLFGALDDDDPHGVLWSVFYLLEGLDDDYLRGLVTALPELVARAPRWAETAVLRIVNTRGEPEDCIDALVAVAREQKAPARKRLVAVLEKLTRGLDGLHPSQKKTLVEIACAVAA